MENLDFFLNCILNFAIVFLVLYILALAIRLIVVIFPEKINNDSDDSSVLAALNTHLNRVYPNSRLTKIEEQK